MKVVGLRPKFVSADDMRGMTGYVRQALQVQWLRQHRIPHQITTSGRLLVLRKDCPSVMGDSARSPPHKLDMAGNDEPVRWSPPAYNPLSLEALRGLPKIGKRANTAGVYFLWSGETLVYIGSSQNVRARVTDHCAYPVFQFDCATFLAVEWPWQWAIEVIYIRRYMPQQNGTHK